REAIDVDGIEAALASGALDYFGVGASSYTSGRHAVLSRCRRALPPWARPGRGVVPSRIGLDHLLAPAALPLVFAPVPLAIEGGIEYFGDGTMRQRTPLSPLSHAGAGRILAIGVAPGERAGLFEAGAARPGVDPGKPTLAQVAGHALASIMFDALPADAERLQLANQALALITPELRRHLPYRPAAPLTQCHLQSII